MYDPLVVEVSSHLHPEIEMSQLSKQVQWCRSMAMCVYCVKTVFSIYVALSTAFGQSSCQVRLDSFFIGFKALCSSLISKVIPNLF